MDGVELCVTKVKVLLFSGRLRAVISASSLTLILGKASCSWAQRCPSARVWATSASRGSRSSLSCSTRLA